MTYNANSRASKFKSKLEIIALTVSLFVIALIVYLTFYPIWFLVKILLGKENDIFNNPILVGSMFLTCLGMFISSIVCIIIYFVRLSNIPSDVPQDEIDEYELETSKYKWASVGLGIAYVILIICLWIHIANHRPNK
jgi:hypothetical protein